MSWTWKRDQIGDDSEGFPLAQYEVQTTSSRIWTRVAMSLSNNSNHERG